MFALRAMESRQARLAALPVPLDSTRMSPAAKNVLSAHLDLRPMELAQYRRRRVMMRHQPRATVQPSKVKLQYQLFP